MVNVAHATVPDLIYTLFGQRIKRRLAEDHYRPRGFTDLTHAFEDEQGRVYYTWRDVGELPTLRFGKVQTLMRLADAGLSQDERKKIGSDIIRIVQDKIIAAKSQQAKSQAAAELVVMAKELLVEGAEVIPEDVYYELASTCCAREDEDPRTMDRTIHTQKFVFFKDAGIRGADFFLLMPPFRELLRASLTSEAGLMELLPIWNRERKRRETIREVFERRSVEPERTSDSSSAASQATTKRATRR